MAKLQTISAPIAAATGDDATRKALVVAAFRLFAMEGVGAVSLRRITASAGAANQSAIHYHFSNRLGLVRAVLDHVNEMLGPLQTEAIAELDAVARERRPSVDEIVRIGLSPYVHLHQTSDEGERALRFLSRLTWESGADAQKLMLEKVRPYFLRLLPFLERALPHKSAEALDFQLYMAAANVIHGLADITLLGQEPMSSVDRLYKERPLDMLRYFYDYIAAGLAGPCTSAAKPAKARAGKRKRT
ncbi:TetR/AcrR family transcriptional regulator [Sinimarinibacterium flocculans]|uniref:TetR family transcriptional regulator n=1 Tax=Sinimarinibacterium flocculans TaxID=985250 RepID=A0A318E9A6_9GAMM|nr:TetR/AcrR family transcriptional regulator [Sinimarinibacterium flocculans]PXV68581.1 TetR family transcriptional regulator [Sinimarinibacterium flocculans]